MGFTVSNNGHPDSYLASSGHMGGKSLMVVGSILGVQLVTWVA